MTTWSVLIEAEAPPVADEIGDDDPRVGRFRARWPPTTG